MSEQTTFTDADRNDGVEPDMVDQNAAPASQATGAGVVPMNMIQALNSAIDVKMAEDPTVVSYGEDAGYFGGVFRVTDKLQQKHGLTRSFEMGRDGQTILEAALAASLPLPVEVLAASGVFASKVGFASPDDDLNLLTTAGLGLGGDR